MQAACHPPWDRLTALRVATNTSTPAYHIKVEVCHRTLCDRSRQFPPRPPSPGFLGDLSSFPASCDPPRETHAPTLPLELPCLASKTVGDLLSATQESKSILDTRFVPPLAADGRKGETLALLGPVCLKTPTRTILRYSPLSPALDPLSLTALSAARRRPQVE